MAKVELYAYNPLQHFYLYIEKQPYCYIQNPATYSHSRLWVTIVN